MTDGAGSSAGLAERGPERAARVYTTLALAYEAIVRIRRRLPLFEEVCRVLVEQGQVRMAWVGEVDDQGWIVPVAQAGTAEGYLDDLRVSVRDVPEGRGPTGTAARECRHVFTADIASDERMAPWREAALARGFRSSAAFPLMVDDRCVAVLTAYASEPGFFAQQQVELFDRLAADLSFASEAMERNERRRAAEAELRSSEERLREAEAERRSSEERFRATAESLLDSFTIVSPVRDPGGEIIDFRHEYINDAYCALVGFDRAQLLGHRIGELFPRFPNSDRFAIYRRVAETREPCRNDAVEGEGAWAGTRLATRVIDTVIAPLGENLVVSARDVTERKRAEQELRLRGELLDLAHDAVIVRDPVDSRVKFWNREAEAIYGYSREEATGRVTHELLGTEFPGSARSVDETLAREGRWDGELRHTRKDGTVIVVSSRQALACDEEGKPLAVIALNSDVTARKHAEVEFAQTAALLERTQEISNTAGWEYDLATEKTTWTDEVYRIVGLDPSSDPPGLAQALAAYDAESAPVIGEAFERLIADGEPFDLELGLIRGDRQRIWVRVIGRPVVQNGRVVRVNGAIADITERMRNEQELQLRAELLELAHDAVIVRDPRDSRVQFWNRGAEAIYGYSRAEAVGCVTHELLATVFPDSTGAVDETLAREGRWVGELRHTRKDGEVIIVASRQALQRGEDGRPLAIIELNSDITERKRAEEELAETTGLLERTQQISKTGGWEYDLATGKLTWTDEVYRIYGTQRRYGPVELERAISAFDPESAPIISAALERLIADGEPSDLEAELIRADGRRIWVRVVGLAVVEGGRVVRVHGIIADVSDRRLVEEELRALNAELEQRVAARTAALERANHELESFAYSVSHDLRAPLRALDGFSKTLLDAYEAKLDEEGRHYLERIRAAAVRMGNLIDEILQLSRLSRRRCQRVRLDMSSLASEVVAELNDAEPDRRRVVEIQDGMFAEADRELVRTVLQNLLANAYKFTAKTRHPDIRLGTADQDGVLVYSVADNGAGFDMAHARGRLFRPFHRLHRESEFPGDGIGLATVARCVHRHGGEVWAEGAVNQGATFCFSLTPGAHPPASAATGRDVVPGWQPADGAEPE